MSKLPHWMYGRSRLPGVDISQLPGWTLLKEPEPEPQPQEAKESENEDDNTESRHRAG